MIAGSRAQFGQTDQFSKFSPELPPGCTELLDHLSSFEFKETVDLKIAVNVGWHTDDLVAGPAVVHELQAPAKFSTGRQREGLRSKRDNLKSRHPLSTLGRRLHPFHDKAQSPCSLASLAEEGRDRSNPCHQTPNQNR